MTDGDFTERQNYPFMVGVYLAVNAISDAFLLVDGPDCAHMKTQYVQGNHDWLSTLTDISGFHRVANTALHPFHMARSREDELVAQLKRMAEHSTAGAVIITPMPMAAITGVDYDRLARLVREQCEQKGRRCCDVLHIPGRSLSGDWLTGYALTLTSLAKHLELQRGKQQKNTVAIVGYLMDRNEGDHRANHAVLERLLGDLGLELVSTWLSGGTVADLKDIEKASAIISLPYGRRAARTLARRLQVPIIETDLPFGFEGTTRWLRTIAAATNNESRVDSIMERELPRTTAPLQWVVPAVLLHRRAAFIGDPHLLEGFLELSAELGLHHGPMMVTASEAHASESLLSQRDNVEMAFEPKRGAMMRFLEPLRRGDIDVIVTNSSGSSLIGGATPVLEFGFPSYFTHALYDRPFLGYDGALAFVDSLANELRRGDLLRRQSFYAASAPRHPTRTS